MQVGQTLQMPDPCVGDGGIIQVQFSEVGQPLQMGQPGIRDGGIAEFENPELLQPLDVVQPCYRRRGSLRGSGPSRLVRACQGLHAAPADRRVSHVQPGQAGQPHELARIASSVRVVWLRSRLRSRTVSSAGSARPGTVDGRPVQIDFLEGRQLAQGLQPAIADGGPVQL